MFLEICDMQKSNFILEEIVVGDEVNLKEEINWLNFEEIVVLEKKFEIVQKFIDMFVLFCQIDEEILEFRIQMKKKRVFFFGLSNSLNLQYMIWVLCLFFSFFGIENKVFESNVVFVRDS